MTRPSGVPVPLAICQDAWIVLDHGDKVGVFSNEATARRVADLIAAHGLMAVPDDLAGVTA